MSRNRPSRRPADSPRQTRNQLRIIGGKWRGRKLAFPAVEGLRPSGDRVRETLFNWLSSSLPGARCLDLFAGSGALGLEALSRGANYSALVERNAGAVDSLRSHCRALGADARVFEADALAWLAQNPGEHFDLVFLDPPFAENLLAPGCQLLESQGWLAQQALVYVECDASDSPGMPDNWRLYRQQTSGRVSYRLYRRTGDQRLI